MPCTYVYTAYTAYLRYDEVGVLAVLCAYSSGSAALSSLTPIMMTSFVLDKLRVIAGKGAPRQRAQHRIALPSSGKETARRSGLCLLKCRQCSELLNPQPLKRQPLFRATRKGAGCCRGRQSTFQAVPAIVSNQRLSFGAASGSGGETEPAPGALQVPSKSTHTYALGPP